MKNTAIISGKRTFTTIRVKYRPSMIEGKVGSIYIRVIHQRQYKHLLTGYKVRPNEWDSCTGRIIVSASSPSRGAVLKAIERDVDNIVNALSTIVMTLRDKGTQYTVDDIFKAYNVENASSISLFSYIQNVADDMLANSRYSTYRHYISTLSSLRHYAGEAHVSLADVTKMWVKEYERHLLIVRKVSLNTASFYVRCLRAIYNRAVQRGIVADVQPFACVYTGVAQTKKRAVTEDIMRCIRSLDLRRNPRLALSRDLFMLSFFLRGMPFVDMSYLKNSDIRDGMLVYHRRKTGQELSVRWEQCMQEIVDRHKDSATDGYLLPILNGRGQNTYRQYANASMSFNRYLHIIGKMIGMERPLTMYCARHAWVSIAFDKGIDIDVISECLGHRSVKTTHIYLDTLESERIHNANKTVLNFLSKGDK